MAETFKSLTFLENQKEAIYIRAELEMTSLYVTEVKRVLKWFRDKFPKRHLRWVDGMGTHFWVLDGDIFDCDILIKRCGRNGMDSSYTERGWSKKEVLLKPLVDFQVSIEDETYAPESGIQIGEWEIDRVSKEIRQC